MAVPTPMVKLHEPHAPLDKPPSQQAIVRERDLARLGAVHLVDRLWLARDVHQLGHGRLHAICHLVLLDARDRLGVADFIELHAIEVFECIEHAAAGGGVHARRIGDIQNRVAL